MVLETLISNLGEKIGLPELALDENNLCRMVFDDKWTLDLEALAEEGLLFLYASVCEVPPKDRETLFAALLRANLFGRETGGFAHFGLDDAKGEILLSCRFETEKLDHDEFEKAVAMFLERVEFWTDQAAALMEKKGPDDADKAVNQDWMMRV